MSKNNKISNLDYPVYNMSDINIRVSPIPRTKVKGSGTFSDGTQITWGLPQKGSFPVDIYYAGQSKPEMMEICYTGPAPKNSEEFMNAIRQTLSSKGSPFHSKRPVGAFAAPLRILAFLLCFAISPGLIYLLTIVLRPIIKITPFISLLGLAYSLLATLILIKELGTERPIGKNETYLYRKTPFFIFYWL